MTDNQMDILKAALDWTKAEMFSSAFFALFGVMFILASYCFWQFGKTDTAKAYIIPLLVVGGLLVILGVGLVISNQIRLSNFPVAFEADWAAFLASEIARADKTVNGYETAIYRALPLIALISAGLLLFVKTPIWQASLVGTLALMAIILLIDTNAHARMAAYKDQLQQLEQQHK